MAPSELRNWIRAEWKASGLTCRVIRERKHPRVLHAGYVVLPEGFGYPSFQLTSNNYRGGEDLEWGESVNGVAMPNSTRFAGYFKDDDRCWVGFDRELANGQTLETLIVETERFAEALVKIGAAKMV